MTSLELAKEAAKYLNNKKAEEIKIVKIEDISSLTDYFVFATGTSNTHVNALADELEVGLKSVGIMPDHMEGHSPDTGTDPESASGILIHQKSPENSETGFSLFLHLSENPWPTEAGRRRPLSQNNPDIPTSIRIPVPSTPYLHKSMYGDLRCGRKGPRRIFLPLYFQGSDTRRLSPSRFSGLVCGCGLQWKGQ